jgi:hypothetical protein
MPRARDWHTWFSLALALPLVLIGVTAVLIAHGKALGLKDIPVVADWLPGYGPAALRQEGNLLRAALADGDGLVIASKQGLHRAGADGLTPLAGAPQAEFRQLVDTPQGLLAAGPRGLYRVAGGQAETLLQGEVWSVTLGREGRLIATTKEDGVLASGDGGRSWQPDGAVTRAAAPLAEAGGESLPLGKLILDLHTGKAFLGKRYEWLWIDAAGAVMILLGLTGVWMWSRGERRKRRLAAAADEPARG